MPYLPSLWWFTRCYASSGLLRVYTMVGSGDFHLLSLNSHCAHPNLVTIPIRLQGVCGVTIGQLDRNANKRAAAPHASPGTRPPQASVAYSLKDTVAVAKTSDSYCIF